MGQKQGFSNLMDKKCANENRFYLIQDLDENVNFAWLTQKTDDPKNYKGNLTSFWVCPPFLAKTFVPPK